MGNDCCSCDDDKKVDSVLEKTMRSSQEMAEFKNRVLKKVAARQQQGNI